MPRRSYIEPPPADYIGFNKELGEDVEIVVGIPSALDAYK